MKRLPLLFVMAIGAIVFALGTSAVHADPIPRKYRKAIQKGLQWLVKNQARDGHWAANGSQYPTAMTALAGMALLGEGSTLNEGKYSKQIRKCADWLMKNAQRGGRREGLISDPSGISQSRYMYGHGFSLLFLASVYGDEKDKQRREKLKGILTRAAKYCANAQSTQGGWYYTSKQDGGDNDEGSVTITQLQALRAAKNAGIPVPQQTIKKAQEYLKKSTTQRGGVVYRLGRGGFRGAVGGERPALTAAAIACAFSSGDYKSELVKKWFKYCRTAIPITGGRRMGHDEYTHYYYGQALFILGDDGWEKLYGKTPKDQRLLWSVYRKSKFDELVQRQSPDGSWSGSIGTVYATSIYLTIMQLDRAVLPIYQR